MKTIFMARAQWNGTKVKPLPAPPLVISIWVAGAAATPILTHVSYVCVCVCVLYMCPFDLIEVFQHNYRALRAKSTATNQRCRVGGGGGAAIEAIEAHNALISGTHTHTLALVRPLDFATFCGVCICMRPMRRIRNKRHLQQLPSSSSNSNSGCSSAVGKGGDGEESAETMLGGNKNASYKMNFYAAFSQCLQRCAHK